jgi:predicted peptidase
MPGAFGDDWFSQNPCTIADMPVWVFGNANDGTFQAYDWDTKTKPAVRSCLNFTNEFTLTIYQNNCGHGCWDEHWAKPEVQNWLVNQSRP